MAQRKTDRQKSQSKKNMEVIETIAKPEKRNTKMESSSEMKKGSRQKRSSK